VNISPGEPKTVATPLTVSFRLELSCSLSRMYQNELLTNYISYNKNVIKTVR